MGQEHTHERHKPPSTLTRPRELIVACPAMRSNVNLSRIVRAAGCCGVQKMVAAGAKSVDPKIARDALEQVEIQWRRTLPAPLKKLQSAGYALVGLEQATHSVSLHDYQFPHKTVLVVGHERHGIEPEMLQLMDAVVEIPVWGMPFSYNVATAAVIAMYEYCRQFPQG